ncbi:alpha/beta fold hydrolase [Streptomyces sp. YIM 98790]|uniref:alpha/beta fold hydrolase n=1 Tax=Streptomyces sp. YIM 98790 TaxID=2689077 RepID=UPI001409C138|nr:alpha/beta fold hydrolase [Streptomyces sp. YIM 98790]
MSTTPSTGAARTGHATGSAGAPTSPRGGTPAPRWLRGFHDRESAAARLVCFPHAGGAANAFAALSAALPEDIGLLAVQYPGRQDRRAEPCADTIAALAAGVAGALTDGTEGEERGGVPLFLLGHSMGALVAFETARLLQDRSGPEAARLFVSAARSPSADWAEPDVDALSDEQVVSELRRLGGVPEALLSDPETVRELLRLLRADVRALRRHRAPRDAVLTAPVTVLLSAGDPKNSLAQMAEWAAHTKAGHAVETLDGGHFALIEQSERVAELITGAVRADLAAPGPAPAAPAAPTTRADAGAGTPADLVRDILVAGLDGRRPRLTTEPAALEDAAREQFSPEAFGYVSGTAGTGATGRANRAAFDRWRLVPRMLRGAVRRDLAVSVAGQRLPAPVLLAPLGGQAVVHPEGELASARAAAATGLPFVLSTFASRSLEEVAEQAGPGPRWFQLYLPSERAVAESLVRRAERNGYTALVLTVDAGFLGFRPAELDPAYSPYLRGIGIANFTSDPAFRAGLPPEPDGAAVVRRWAQISTDPALVWEDVAWLRSMTGLPLLVKGILHPEDARLALEHGAQGVVVSNHGGRQLDGGIAALDALPAVRAAVGGDVPVLMDSGVRNGSDVLKALALGADAVLYGRPYVYGLGLDGQRGVEHVLRCLLADLDLALALTGCASARAVTADLVVPRDRLPGPLPGAAAQDPAAQDPAARTRTADLDGAPR